MNPLRITIILLLLFISVKVIATPQDYETLIYGKDTMYMDFFPLEQLMNINKELEKKILNASDCIQTSCWRGHHGTWKIINDSLFLVKLEDGCNEKELELSQFFESSKICSNGIFAYWFSNRIKANYGKLLDFDEYLWESIHEGIFNCDIKKGIVTNLRIEMKEPSEIEKTMKERAAKEDTMICLIVDEYPKLFEDNKEYEIEEIKDFIINNIRYPTNEIDCMGSVFISFIVEKDGTVTNKEFVRKLCEGYDEEAMKVIELMTTWKPGLIKGVPVRTKLTFPLRYKYD